MRSLSIPLTAAASLVLLCTSALATDLKIHLAGDQHLKRITVLYKCDASGVKLGLPSGTFTVLYVIGAENDLAILPLHKSSVIFVRVVAASGARYTSGMLTWWEAGAKGATLSSVSVTDKASCHTTHEPAGLENWNAPDPLPQQP
jgi:membrane-bound inhibitor of C-type lysozyme